MWDWLISPMDPSRVHDVGWHLSWHARLMTLAWGGLAPLGVLIARFFKVLPWQNWPHKLDSKLWWNTHRALQYAACGLMIVAIALIWGRPLPDAPVRWHRLLGWALMGLVAVQILGGALRGTKGGPTDPRALQHLHGDHYDMTLRRLIFEYIHKAVGYTALLLSMVVILMGLWQANGYNWMWLILVVWWSLLIAVFLALNRRGMAVSTYQAIWGPDPSLPGNTRPQRRGNRQAPGE